MRFLKIILSSFRTFLSFNTQLSDNQQYLFPVLKNSKQHTGFSIRYNALPERFNKFNNQPIIKHFQNPLHIEGHSTTTKVAGCFFLHKNKYNHCIWSDMIYLLKFICGATL